MHERAHPLAADVAAGVHARLRDWAIDAITHGAQSRDLSGHEGDMLLNGAYLIEADRADGCARSSTSSRRIIATWARTSS